MELSFAQLTDAMRKALAERGNRATTIDSRMNSLKTLWKMHGYPENAVSFLSDLPGLIKRLEDKYSNQKTIRNYLYTCLMAIDVLTHDALGISDEDYEKLQNRLRELDGKVSEERAENPEPAYLAENRQLTWAALQDIKAPGLDGLLIALYTFVPPRRLDPHSLKYSDGRSDGNYYDLKKRSLVYSEYKTSHAYGRIEIPLDHPLLPRGPELAGLLQADYERNPRAFIFDNEGQAKFGIRITKTFARYSEWTGVTTRLLRRLYSTHLSMGPPMSDGNRQLLALWMGHSLSMNHSYAILDRVADEYKSMEELQKAYSELLDAYNELYIEHQILLSG